MFWNIDKSVGTLGKWILYGTGVTAFITLHLIILLLTHAAIISVQYGITMDEAITPLHSMVMADRWAEGYYLMRETVFSEIPFFPEIRDMFFARSGLQWSDLFYSAVKVSCGGVISYGLCRVNTLISSTEHPVLLCVLNSFWTSISTFSTLILIEWTKTFSMILCIAVNIVMMVVSVGLLTIFSKKSMKKMGVPIKTKRIFGIHFSGILEKLMDSLFVFIISCLTFDIFSSYIEDGIILILFMLILAGILTIAYNMLKEFIRTVSL